jgi:hypothetical protein
MSKEEEEAALFRLAGDTKESATNFNLLTSEMVTERPVRRMAPETNDSEGDPYSNDEFGESPDLNLTENLSGTDPNLSARPPVTAQNDYGVDVQDQGLNKSLAPEILSNRAMDDILDKQSDEGEEVGSGDDDDYEDDN